MISPESAREFVGVAVDWLRLGLETFGAGTIALGAALAIGQLAAAALAGKVVRFAPSRLTLSRYLSLALEFQLAADVLETAIAPGWNDIGHLAAIATIRTALNYFLSKEITEEREGVVSR